MKRSVRNGIAIAGMAGGIWFLGSAVANADQAADAANDVGQASSSESTGDGGSLNGAGNLNASSADATNVQKTDVDTDVDGGDGGENVAYVNTGAAPAYVVVGANSLSTQVVEQPEPQPVHEITAETGDVHVTQNANGGDVSGSGNVHASGNSGDQTATAANNVHQTATSTSEDEDGGWKDDKRKNGHDEGSLNLAGNVNESESDATNIDVTDIETDVDGGDGGSNYADINTGIYGNTFHCPEGSTCHFNFTTGSVTVVQNANGGSVYDSGNVNVGGDGYGHPHSDHHGDKPGYHHDGDCPENRPAHKPAVKPASAPTYHHYAPSQQSPYAQPAGQLAYTGADVSLPLTVGLIALGAGFALTAAGRRRATETV